MLKKNKQIEPTLLQEGIDYYIDHGAWVFTAYFLQNRGYCCGSGCRHCPYDKKGVRERGDAPK